MGRSMGFAYLQTDQWPYDGYFDVCSEPAEILFQLSSGKRFLLTAMETEELFGLLSGGGCDSAVIASGSD